MGIDVTVIGGRGYVGEILLGLLAKHPIFRISRVGSRSLAGQRLDRVYPELGNAGDRVFEALMPADISDERNVVLALGNGEAEAYVAQLGPAVNVVDLSADHRFDPTWSYGLPETHALSNGSRRIANPGCYATAAQLALAPLRQWLNGAPSVFGVSGFSGAGRKANARNDRARLQDNLIPYALTGHIHESEISHHLQHPVRFMPHVAAHFCGLLVTVSAELTTGVSVDQLRQMFDDYYDQAPLVTVQTPPAEIARVARTNGAIIGGFAVDARDGRRICLTTAIDNLRKGAASQAIQNLNQLNNLPLNLGLTNDSME